MRPRPEHLLRGAPALCHGCPEGSLGTASLLPQPSEWLPPAVCMFVMAMCLSAAMCLHRIFLARLCLSLFILLLCLHERGGNFCFQSGARETSYCYGRSDGWEVISHWILQGWSRGGFLPESGPEGEAARTAPPVLRKETEAQGGLREGSQKQGGIYYKPTRAFFLRKCFMSWVQWHTQCLSCHLETEKVGILSRVLQRNKTDRINL